MCPQICFVCLFVCFSNWPDCRRPSLVAAEEITPSINSARWIRLPLTAWGHDLEGDKNTPLVHDASLNSCTHTGWCEDVDCEGEWLLPKLPRPVVVSCSNIEQYKHTQLRRVLKHTIYFKYAHTQTSTVLIEDGHFLHVPIMILGKLPR